MPSTSSDAEMVELFRAATESGRLELVRDIAKAEDASLPSPATLKAMLADETVPWIRMALEELLTREGYGQHEPARASDALQDDDLYLQALNSAIRQVLHEIAPVVGRARLAAQRQLRDGLAGTRLEHELDSLARVCDGLRRLAAASSIANPTDVELSECIQQLVAGEAEQTPVPLRASGTSPFIVSVDRALLELALGNLLRNAIEATVALKSEDLSGRAVIINWGTMAGSHWVSVIDRGQGLMTEPRELFDRGVSLKAGGRGYGLTTATNALRSLGGDLEISSNDQGGTTATIRWPADLS
jgi:signal transduction histidine kinase